MGRESSGRGVNASTQGVRRRGSSSFDRPLIWLSARIFDIWRLASQMGIALAILILTEDSCSKDCCSEAATTTLAIKISGLVAPPHSDDKDCSE